MNESLVEKMLSFNEKVLEEKKLAVARIAAKDAHENHCADMRSERDVFYNECAKQLNVFCGSVLVIMMDGTVVQLENHGGQWKGLHEFKKVLDLRNCVEPETKVNAVALKETKKGWEFL